MDDCFPGFYSECSNILGFRFWGLGLHTLGRCQADVNLHEVEAKP